MEDDIIFARGWLLRLRSILDDIVKAFSRKWVLSLYTPSLYSATTMTPLEAFRSGKKWIHRPYDFFFGAVALLYPLEVRDAYIQHITKPEWSWHLPHDHTLPIAMKELGIPILATAPCLVQHIGVISDISGEGPHKRSSSFLESVE